MAYFLVVILISQEQKECALRGGGFGEIAEGYIAGRYLRLGNNS